MKLLLACPTYGPVDPLAARSLRAAVMTAAKHGVEWAGDVSPDRMKFDAARNAVVEAALAPTITADGVFWADSDVVLPTTAIIQLVTRGLDFVTGIYFQRAGNHFPLIATFNEKLQSFQWLVRWPENIVAPIDGCGFGCCYTSTAMLRAMGDSDHFTYKRFSEDFDFCRKATEAGFQLHVDTSVICGHLQDPLPVTYETYKAAHPDYFAGDSALPKEDAHAVQ